MTFANGRSAILRVRRGLGAWLLASALLSLLSALSGPLTLAQEAQPIERVYNHPQADVEKALENLQAYETAELPVLAGFVNAKANTLRDYSNPHYQFQIDLTPQTSGHTLVRVSAKITAWYSGTGSARSQYALIPSNGRLEGDLLDRLSAFLDKGNSQRSSEPAPIAKAAPASASDYSPAINPPSYAVPHPASAPTPSPKEAPTPAETPRSAGPASLASEIAVVQSQLDAMEEKERQSKKQIEDLEAVANARQRFTDFAVTKKAQTPIFEVANDFSKVLFQADAEDEFEVFEARQGWIHVRLADAEMGWLRISELEQPGESSISYDIGGKNFSVANRVIKTFTGEWPVLKGKLALFVLAQPKGDIAGDVLGKSQRDFAAQAFLEGYRAAVHSQQTLSGVVVVFIGPKPGVAAATLSEIRHWQEGRISDKLFFDHCSFDPPDSFRDAPTH